ncbi:HdeD family acid-resistance protein [Gordonia aichiensis]|uniref:HdeD family acid-resistance protein n=1 Tax=Gordonia aichiensis TaxID=36820 RepID=UPI003267613A
MTTHATPSALPNDAVGAVRTFVIFSSLVGLALGIAVLVWPRASLAVVGVLFGIALIVAGVTRLFAAFALTRAPSSLRLLLGVFGGVVSAVGVLATINPSQSLVLLGMFIGVGWIVGGFQDLFGARLTQTMVPAWLVVVSGVVSVLAGIAMIVLPAVATLSAILWILAVLLIVVSLVTLFTVPSKVGAVLA